MRIEAGPVLIGLIFAAATASASPGDASFPPALRGLWAETPRVCDLLLRSPADVPPDRYWLYVSPHRVDGTSAGTAIAATGPRSAQAAVESAPPVVVDYAIGSDGALRETVASENTAMQYVRCR